MGREKCYHNHGYGCQRDIYQTFYGYKPKQGKKLMIQLPNSSSCRNAIIFERMRKRYGFSEIMIPFDDSQYRWAKQAGFKNEDIVLAPSCSIVMQLSRFYYFLELNTTGDDKTPFHAIVIDEPHTDPDCERTVGSCVALLGVTECTPMLTLFDARLSDKPRGFQIVPTLFDLSNFPTNKYLGMNALAVIRQIAHEYHSEFVITEYNSFWHDYRLHYAQYADSIADDTYESTYLFSHDQRDEWTYLNGVIGNNGKPLSGGRAWISTNSDRNEYGDLLGHANNLGWNEMWVYAGVATGMREKTCDEKFEMEIELFCRAAYESGWLERWEESVLVDTVWCQDAYCRCDPGRLWDETMWSHDRWPDCPE